MPVHLRLVSVQVGEYFEYVGATVLPLINQWYVIAQPEMSVLYSWGAMQWNNGGLARTCEFWLLFPDAPAFFWITAGPVNMVSGTWYSLVANAEGYLTLSALLEEGLFSGMDRKFTRATFQHRITVAPGVNQTISYAVNTFR